MQGHINWLRVCAAGMAALGLSALTESASAQPVSPTVTYQYDSLGRVISAGSTNGATTTYQYDPAGNRTNQTITTSKPIAGPVYFPLNERTSDQNYSAQAVPLNLKGAPSTSVAIYQTPGFNAVASSDGHTIKYLPNIDFYGTDSFQYLASNANGASAPATVTVNVKLLPPIATAITQAVAANSVKNAINTVTIQAQSALGGGQVANISISGCTNQQVQQNLCRSQHGTINQVSADLSTRFITILYSPDYGYTGSDTFTYQVSNSSSTTPSSAPVNLTVKFGLATWGNTKVAGSGFTWGVGVLWPDSTP